MPRFLTVIGLLLLLAAPAHASSLATSPWPEMRHDSRNTGRSPIAARYYGDRPWAFRTGRGIFSTPVIGPDGTAYVGSADTYFYAVGAGGRLRWRLKTGGIIDAGGALAATGGATALTFGSADENLYHVTTPARPGQHPRILWRFRPTVAPVKGQQVNWWEGPVAIGPNGDIYAGNTGGTAYAVTPGGRLAWKFTAGGSLWTEPAFAPGGSSYWGSLDFNVYRVDAGGRPVWHTFTPGFVISSPAIGSDGTVYIASFDSKLYALDPQTGTPRWTFPTSDHVYASPALQRDAAGRTTGIYIASADGSVYALTPGGRLRWRYDTGDPIRSSPALGPAAGHGHGQGRRDIVYVGSSNGKLYGINADTGRRRWSYDTTPDDPVLRDRNDLNASPALGRTGVYIAGEHGYVDYVPYDYCLHRADARCSTSPAQELGNQLDRVFPVSPGGSTLATTHLTGVSPATVINLRLIVRRHGRTVNAAILDPRHVITTTPHFAFDIQESGDGHFLYVVPRGLLRPGMRARLRIAGAYTDNGAHMGNFDAHGPVAGHFRQTITLTTVGETKRLPLDTGTRRVTAITIRRLAVPMPAFLPSVNQIGFDSYDWIMSTIARTKTHVLVWVIGAVADARGVERVDPRSAFAFPMAGRYAGRSLALSSQNVSLQFSFGPAPLRRYEMRGSLTPQASFEPGAALYAETVCATVPNYGPELKFTGICNPGGLLAASGTFTSSPYAGSAASAPPGLHVATLRLTRPTAGAAGSVVARLAGHLLARRHHVAAVLLTNATSGLPLSLDYRSDTRAQVDGAGRITGVQLTLPRGTRLPAHIRAYVIADAFPLASRGL